MTDDPNPKEAIVDEVTEQVDVGSLVAGDSVSEQVDGASLGRAVGEAVGALAGRYLGRAAFDWLVSKLPFQHDDDGERSLLRRLISAFIVALRRTLSRPEFRNPIENTLREYIKRREKSLDEVKETAEEAATDAKEAVEDMSDENSSIDPSDLDANEIQAIREETYRDLLEKMEYSELQSIAKEVGVKANLEREELVDAIAEEFNDGSEADEERSNTE
ncbi:hypothetical protein [Haladaptatus halobius]|uniref:hypothetical protein n=1 Tax=Haladaptatus halobius TaxID=2884875 RepID=UPI001D0A3DA8|nr:hypothetical protein [Haladaptatus halobius]